MYYSPRYIYLKLTSSRAPAPANPLIVHNINPCANPIVVQNKPLVKNNMLYRPGA